MPTSQPKVAVHKGKVLDTAFSPFNNQMLGTTSDDCTARVTVIPDKLESVFKADVILQGHEKKVVQIKWHPTADNVVATASADHTVKFWDVQKQAETASLEHGNTVDHVEWNRDGSRAVSCSKDHKVRIWDPRDGKACDTFDGLPGNKKSSVMFMDNHGLICQVGFNKTSTRQFQIWDAKKTSEPVKTFDIDQSAGVFVTMYDPDNSILYLGGKGDSSIRYFEIVNEAPYAHGLSEFRDTKMQKGLGWLPKRGCDIKKCEIAIALRVMRDAIIPVSFQVPRKSDMFQKDLYPDTYAGIAAMTADEWFGGANKDPVLSSMKPGEETEQEATAFVAAKSPAELQKELDVALARIKELEAELASK